MLEWVFYTDTKPRLNHQKEEFKEECRHCIIVANVIRAVVWNCKRVKVVKRETCDL